MQAVSSGGGGRGTNSVFVGGGSVFVAGGGSVFVAGGGSVFVPGGGSVFVAGGGLVRVNGGIVEPSPGAGFVGKISDGGF